MHPDLLRHGRFSWTELMTADVAAAKAFYGELFGWTFTAHDADASYLEIQAEGQSIGGLCNTADCEGSPPPSWGTYVTVADIEATAAKVLELGGTLLVGPQDIPGVGRFAVIQDPQGAVIMAITYAFGDGCA